MIRSRLPRPAHRHPLPFGHSPARIVRFCRKRLYPPRRPLPGRSPGPRASTRARRVGRLGSSRRARRAPATWRSSWAHAACSGLRLDRPGDLSRRRRGHHGRYGNHHPQDPPFLQARVCLLGDLLPRTGTGRAPRGDAAASYTVWKARTTSGEPPSGGRSGATPGAGPVSARGRCPGFGAFVVESGWSGFGEDRRLLAAGADAGSIVHAECPDAGQDAGRGVLEGDLVGLYQGPHH